MSKKSEQQRAHIPRTLIAYVHETSNNNVRVAFATGRPASKEYKETEEQLQEAVESVKQSKQKK